MQTWITGFIFNIFVCQMLSCLCERVFLKDTLVLMCLTSFYVWHFRQMKEIFGYRDIYFSKKYIKIFLLCGSLHYCRKVKYILSSHFTEVISTNLLNGKEFFVFKYKVKYKQIISISHYFYWNFGDSLNLSAHPLMISIIFHTRRPNTHKPSVTYLVFMFHLIFIFRILMSWKACFSHRSISVLKSFGCLNVSNRVSKLNKGKILIIVWSILKICHLELAVIMYKLMYECSLWISVS